MKKNGFKALLAAVLLSIGVCSGSAYAASDVGWKLSNNTWVYLDQYNQKVTNEWRKGADNLWRYLNSQGEMAVNGWAADEYYVDANGIMVTDKWEKLSQYGSRDSDLKWYYFGSSGKVVKDGWKKIDGKNYLFDSDGTMVTGWSEDGIYYLGDDGAMRTGWRYLEPAERDDGWESENSGPESEDGKYWYYFSSNGKKYTPSTSDDGGDFKVYKIDGKYFCFNYNGQMQTGWVYLNGDPETAEGGSISDWRYFAETSIKNATLGSAVPGWLSLEPPEQLQESVDDPVQWYYFEKDGEAKTGPKEGEASTNDFIKVQGKTYLFNELGNPVSGLQKVQIGETGEYTSYYFDKSSRTAIKGKRRVEEGDGETSDFYFNEGSYAGRGYTGVKNGYLYYMGKRQEADSDTRYILVSLPKSGSYETYVVNTSGRVSKNTTVKDRDGNKYKVNRTGILETINDEAAGKGNLGDPIPPVFIEE